MCELRAVVCADGGRRFRFAQFVPARDDQGPLGYTFDIDEDLFASFYDWETSLQFLLGGNDASYSEDFRRGLPRLQALMVKRDVVLANVEPIDLLIRSTARMETAVQLQHFAGSLRGMKSSDRDDGVGNGWKLKVVALELELNAPFYRSKDVLALNGILQLGIPVEFLRLRALPRMKSVISDADADAFVKLIRILNGLFPNERGQLSQVQRLELSLEYYSMQSCRMFCSALAFNPILRELHLKLDEEEDNGDLYRREHRRLWSWLSFALFSGASRNVVETRVWNN